MADSTASRTPAAPAHDGSTAAPRQTVLPVPSRLPSNRALLRVQRACECDGNGTCPECEDARHRIQAKLLVGASHDRFEREADEAARRVAAGPSGGGAAQAPAISSIRDAPAQLDPAPLVDRAGTRLGIETPEKPTTEGRELPPLADGGEPLAADVRRRFEAFFARDLSHVRVHRGEISERANDRLRARAFTYGNHVWLGRRRAASAEELLAHELAHVVQQTDPPPSEAADAGAGSHGGGSRSQRLNRDASGGTAIEGGPQSSVNDATRDAGRPDASPVLIQRQNLPQASTVIRRDYGRGFFLVQTPALGRATLRFQGQPWINFSWRPQESRQLDEQHISFEFEPDLPAPRVTVRVRAPFSVDLQVLQSAEALMADSAAASLRGRRLEVKVSAETSGQLTVFPPSSPIARTIALPTVLLTSYVGDPMRAPVRIGGERGELTDPDQDREADPSAPRTATQRVWIINNQQAFEEFARTHPDTNWAGLTLPDGRVVAYAVTEDALQRLATRVRQRDYRFDIQSDFPGAHVTSVFVAGRPLDSLNDLDNLYFGDELSASAGVPGDYAEAEVFEMGQHSFGRKPLTHDQAVARLRELDAKTSDEIARLETEPGRRFELLRVRGASMDPYLLDLVFFRDRDRLRALPQVVPPIEISANDPLMRVLEFEADRETPDPSIRQFLQRNPPTVETLQRQVVRRAEIAAQQIVIRGISQSLPQFRAVAESDANAALLVLNLSTATEQRRLEILQSLGVGEFFTPLGRLLLGAPVPGGRVGPQSPVEIEARERVRIAGIVADRARAARLIAGETIDGVDLPFFRNKARTTLADLEAAIVRLQAAQTTSDTADKALYEGGPVGVEVRRRVYEQLGFRRLRPDQYPHRDTQGVLPSPLAAGAPAPLAEQLYANYVARQQTIEDLKLAGQIAAAIAIILVSEGAGIYVAELWFGGGAIAQAVVTGVVFTALEMGLQYALTGQSPLDPHDPLGSAARFGGQVALNIAMFGFFKQLNATFGTLSRSGIRTAFGLSEAAFARSVGARAGAGALRLSAMGATFVSLNFSQFMLAHGRPPDARETARLAGEALLSLIVLEVGAAVARPMLENVRIWGRARSTGMLQPEVESLLTDLRALQARLTATEYDPRRLGPVVEGIAAEYEALLVRQRALVEALRNSLRTRGAAGDIEAESRAELERIDAALETLRQARFLHSTGIRPAGDPATAEEATEFFYTDTPQNRAAIVERFGTTNATVGGEGVIRVTQPRPLTFRPAPVEVPARAPEPSTPSGTATAPPPAAEQPSSPAPAPQEPPRPAAPEPVSPAPTTPTPGAATTTPAPDFFTRREMLAQRREALRNRAEAVGLMQAIPDFGPGSPRARPMTTGEMGVRQAAQAALQRIQNLRPRAVRSPTTLAEQETLVRQAEAAAEPEIRRLGRLAYERHRTRLREAGLSMENVRSGELSSMTDAQVGEALAEVPAAQGLGEAQLRGILFAARGPAGGGERTSIRRIFEMARSAAERNAVLENFARLMNQGIPGTYEVLRTMTGSRNNWRGGTHVLDYAVNAAGTTRVAAFEYGMVDDLTGGMRIYDVLLTDGTRIQGKDWSNWFPDSLRSQFRRDVLIMTRQFATPEGIQRVRWVFRAPGPQPETVIRDTMQQALEDVMREFNVAPERRLALRQAFDSHTGLVEFWAGSVPAAPSTAPPPGLGTPAAP